MYTFFFIAAPTTPERNILSSFTSTEHASILLSIMSLPFCMAFMSEIFSLSSKLKKELL